MTDEKLETTFEIQLLRADDVARYLCISRSKTYQLMQFGEIPTVRIGRNVRVLLSDLEAYITQCRNNGKGTN